MRYVLFFRDEFFYKDEFYMVRVKEEEFLARVDFISEHFEIVKEDLELNRTGYYANNILFGIVTKK